MSRDPTTAEVTAERAAARGMTYGEYAAWRRDLRADYKRTLASPGRMMATALTTGALFMLLDPNAELGVTMCNRPMTAEEHAEYSASPAAWRRRRPGSTIDDDEDRAYRKRTAALIREAEGTRTFGSAPREVIQ